MTNALATLPATDNYLADLLLVRMALPNPTPKKVREDIGQLLREGPSVTEFENLRSDLVSAGLLAIGKRNVFALTDAGRERALRFLGLTEIPPRMNWSAVISKCFLPKATGLSPDAAAKLDSGDKLSAFVLKQKYGLPSSAGLTVIRVLEAIVCRELGFPEETTLAGLLRAALSKLLRSDKQLSKEDLAAQIPRFETGLIKINAETVRRKLVGDWLANLAPAVVSRTPQPDPEPLELAAFAATVLELAANSPPQDRFHDNKVFIASLWRASQNMVALRQLSLSEFKKRLLEANSRHLLHLSRADLVQAMDPQLVAESETAYLNAIFHFVLLNEPRP